MVLNGAYYMNFETETIIRLDTGEKLDWLLPRIRDELTRAGIEDILKGGNADESHTT